MSAFAVGRARNSLAAWVVAFFGLGQAQATECPSYTFDDSVDYFDPAQQAKIRGIESNHLNSNVENLVRGQSSGVGGDLRFILNIVPNHHRAMTALARLSQRDRSETPAETGPYTVSCWLHRATVFSPTDGRSFLIYGVHLARLNKTRDAITQLEQADQLIPADANVAYNLGLLYFDLKDYSRSLEFAKRAYAAEFPLPGLRNKLVGAGQWRD